MSESPFKISIDRQVIKLLGAHLYGDTPSVINELIANSYDAGAKRIWVTLKTSFPYQIIVQDDGIGMSLNEINNFYLNIGYNRREEDTIQSELSGNGINRPDMGHKGIGKLAAFSLSKIVKLISKKNNSIIGCLMDYDIITRPNGQPSVLDESECVIEDDKLSDNGTGSKIILENVVKNLNRSYQFIVSSIARSFVLNNEVKIYIKKDNEKFQEIKRGRLNYAKYIDVLATIGSDNDVLIDKVKNNNIEEKYKTIIKYEDLVEETASNKSNKKRFDSLPKTIKVFDKTKSNQVDFNFSFKGWIGTVENENSFKLLLTEDGYLKRDLENKEITIIDDNRISIYSRGKVGEYNILPKLKTKAANDAYIIGEIFVDDFEDDSLIDMATSNRRGYQEDDSRYETLCSNLKLLVSRVISSKQKVNNRRREDKEIAERNEIKENFESGHIKSKKIFENMPEEDKKAIEEDHMQFSRAINLEYKENGTVSKLLISHKQDELREFGDFIINVMLKLNSKLKNRIVFTSNPLFGLKKGANIFDELKECFRPEYYVLFLFTKSFYDSNVCLAEAGAAWATNRNYMNIVVDIGFTDVEKPLENTRNGAKFSFKTKDEIDSFSLAIKAVLEAIDKPYDLNEIKEIIKAEIESKKYSLSLPIYYPKRKHQLYPICSVCKKSMKPKLVKGKIEYTCDSHKKVIKAIVE